MNLPPARDTLDILNVLKEYHRSDDGKADGAQNIFRYKSVNEGPRYCGSHRNEANIVRYECNDDLTKKHYKEDLPVERKNNAAEARKSLTAFKSHIEWQDMTEDTSASRQSKGKLKIWEHRSCDRYCNAGLSYIEDSADKTDALTEKDNGIGSTCVMGASFSDIESVHLSNYVRRIDRADQITHKQTKKILHSVPLLSQYFNTIICS